LLAAAALVCGAAWGQAPSYSANSFVNASDYSPGPFAPNSVVSLFGANLSYQKEAVVTSTPGDKLPTQLGGVTVVVGNKPAPLLYVDSGQINFLIPADETPGDVKVQVVRQSVAGPAVTLTLVEAAPALFSLSGYALAQDFNNKYATVTPDVPARGWDTVVLYATGLGHTQPYSEPGEIAATAANLENQATLKVLLNGTAIDATLVKYAGVTPGFAGLYQINFILPPGLSTDAEIRVSVAGQTSVAGVKLATQ
jgi:uncharacterized protein (TIGR03437 family)